MIYNAFSNPRICTLVHLGDRSSSSRWRATAPSVPTDRVMILPDNRTVRQIYTFLYSLLARPLVTVTFWTLLWLISHRSWNVSWCTFHPFVYSLFYGHPLMASYATVYTMQCWPWSWDVLLFFRSQISKCIHYVQLRKKQSSVGRFLFGWAGYESHWLERWDFGNEIAKPTLYQLC